MRMRACSRYEELISAYIDNELSRAEEAELMAHLSECGHCRGLLDMYRQLNAACGELAEPPAALLTGVMEGVRNAPPAAKKRFPAVRILRYAAVAACAALAVFAGRSFLPASVLPVQPVPSDPAAVADVVLPEDTTEPSSGQTAPDAAPVPASPAPAENTPSPADTVPAAVPDAVSDPSPASPLPAAASAPAASPSAPSEPARTPDPQPSSPADNENTAVQTPPDTGAGSSDTPRASSGTIYYTSPTSELSADPGPYLDKNDYTRVYTISGELGDNIAKYDPVIYHDGNIRLSISQDDAQELEEDAELPAPTENEEPTTDYCLIICLAEDPAETSGEAEAAE